jgi:hypothetical protein
VVPARDITAFVDVHVVPMDSERVLAGQTVLVGDGAITAIGAALPVPDGARGDLPIVAQLTRADTRAGHLTTTVAPGYPWHT